MLITYNHGKYIAQTLDSILMQKTQYDYEINVIEDCSTDNTRDVVMEYVAKYPGKVIPYFNEKNLGFKVTQKNFYQGFKRLTGDYLAIIEGDDYWTSPDKLQMQVAFLEANLEYVACAHNVIKTYEDGSKEPHRFLYWPGKPDDHTIEDLIYLKSYFHITTLMFRNVLKGVPHPQFKNPWSCEIFVTVAHAQYGKIRYFDEDMSVYRAHDGGRFSTMKTLDGWFFNIGGLRRYNQWLGYRYLRFFSESIVRYCNVVIDGDSYDGVQPRLTWYQFLKYSGIRICYQVIFLAITTADKIRNVFSHKQLIGSLLKAVVLIPFYLTQLVMSFILALFRPVFSIVRKNLSVLFRKQLNYLHREFIQYEEFGNMRWLWNNGRFFTPLGRHHLNRWLLNSIQVIWRDLIPTPIRKLYRILRTALWYIIAPFYKFARYSKHAFFRHDLRFITWLCGYGKIFTSSMKYHLKRWVSK